MTGSSATDGIRQAVRVVIVDEAVAHVLLLLGFDPASPDSPYWFTVGGAIEDGEDELAAAIRETWEEVGHGLTHADLSGPYGRERVVFEFDGTRIEQVQAYFVAVVAHFNPRFIGSDEVERASTVAARWVPIDGLAQLPEPVFPAHLDEILDHWRRASGTS